MPAFRFIQRGYTGTITINLSCMQGRRWTFVKGIYGCLSNTFSFYSADCVDLDLGMENEKISDGNITVSSVQNASTPAKNGRLNYTSGSSWCARPSDTNPYLQIDLQALYIICAVSTQGNSQADQWVKNYTLQFSNDGTTWMVYREGGQIKVTCQRPCHLAFIYICSCLQNN